MDFLEVAKELQTFAELLREGRVQEADNRAVELQKKIVADVAAAKAAAPPPTPATAAELLTAILDQLHNLTGNSPKLDALLVEYHAKALPPME